MRRGIAKNDTEGDHDDGERERERDDNNSHHLHCSVGTRTGILLTATELIIRIITRTRIRKMSIPEVE